jgi:hypothetical protein
VRGFQVASLRGDYTRGILRIQHRSDRKLECDVEIDLRVVAPKAADVEAIVARVSICVPPAIARFGVISDIDDRSSGRTLAIGAACCGRSLGQMQRRHGCLGFPNGRRPGDDVVDVTLRVAMGALCVLTGPGDTLGVGCSAAVAPSSGQRLPTMCA